MAIDYSVLSLPKGKPLPLLRRERKVAAADKLEKAYAIVDLRDKKRCRVTGRRLVAGHVDEWQDLTRDHLATRGAHPDRVDDPENILTVSRGVHGLLQASALIPVDAKGDETTYVSQIAGYRWNRRQVKAGREPFRLKEFAA